MSACISGLLPRSRGSSHSCSSVPQQVATLCCSSWCRSYRWYLAMTHHPHYSDDGQPLPFASTFEGPAPVSVTGNCIVRQSPLQLPAAEAERLSNAGLKLKQSATCVPDLIISTPKLPAPLAIVTAQEADPDHSNGMDSPIFLDRCSSMASTFRLCCLMIPYTLAAHPAVLHVACDSRFKSKVVLHYYTPSDGLADSILQLVCSLTDGSSSEQRVMVEQERLTLATSCESLVTCLEGMCLTDPQLPDAAGMRALVGVFGSIHQLAHASTEDLIACGCDAEQAHHLYRLFTGVPASK